MVDNQQTTITDAAYAAAQARRARAAPVTAAFTFICENEAFCDEGSIPNLTADQYKRIRAILTEHESPMIVYVNN